VLDAHAHRHDVELRQVALRPYSSFSVVKNNG
jgi:hypothetical protein